MLATSLPMILKNYLSKYLSWVACSLVTRVFLIHIIYRNFAYLWTDFFSQFDKINWITTFEIKWKGIRSWMIRYLCFLNPANYICCEFSGFRYIWYGWMGQIRLKIISAQLKLKLRLSLATKWYKWILSQSDWQDDLKSSADHTALVNWLDNAEMLQQFYHGLDLRLRNNDFVH